MGNKQTNPISKLAEAIVSNMESIADMKTNKAQYDKSFNATILGVNQDFTDDVTEKEQQALIKKYSIPEVPDKDNYYTFKINGSYYVKSSNTNFKLYENVKIRIPNGSWDNMYIEVQRDTINETTDSDGTKWITSVKEPTTEDHELNDGDYWIKIDTEIYKNIISTYVWDSENKVWVEKARTTGRTYTNSTKNQGVVLNGFNSNKIASIGSQALIHGYGNSAEGQNAHAEGNNTSSKGFHSHSEGGNTKANGEYSHTEGYKTETNGKGSHAEGYKCATGNQDFTIRHGDYAHAEGCTTSANGDYSHAEGYGCRTDGEGAHAEGWYTFAEGFCSHSEGRGHSEATIDVGNTLSPCNVFYHGARGDYSHSEGHCTSALGYASHAEGYSTMANGNYSHAGGYGTCAVADYQFVTGCNNQRITSYQGDNVYFIVGGGYFDYDEDGNITKSNPMTAFSVTASGMVRAANSYLTTGADYAEYFEWEDGNTNNEDRRGLFVTFNYDKLILSEPEDIYIAGVVSANPSVLGNAMENEWHGKYKRDIFGTRLKDKEGNLILSDSYKDDNEYIPRSERPEYSPVGTHGQLIVIDDGTCEVNGYCGVGKNGKGTKCEDMEKVYRGLAFRVLERLDDTHIRIFIK